MQKRGVACVTFADHPKSEPGSCCPWSLPHGQQCPVGQEWEARGGVWAQAAPWASLLALGKDAHCATAAKRPPAPAAQPRRVPVPAASMPGCKALRTRPLRAPGSCSLRPGLRTRVGGGLRQGPRVTSCASRSPALMSLLCLGFHSRSG